MTTKDKYQAIRDEANRILNSEAKDSGEAYVPSAETKKLYEELNSLADSNLYLAKKNYITYCKKKKIKPSKINKSKLEEELNKIESSQISEELLKLAESNYNLAKSNLDLYLGGVTQEKAEELGEGNLEDKLLDSELYKEDLKGFNVKGYFSRIGRNAKKGLSKIGNCISNASQKFIESYGTVEIDQADKLTPVKDESEYISKPFKEKTEVKNSEDDFYSIKGGETTEIKIPKEVAVYTSLEDNSPVSKEKALILYKKDETEEPTKVKKPKNGLKNLLENYFKSYGTVGIDQADKLTPVKDKSEYISKPFEEQTEVESSEDDFYSIKGGETTEVKKNKSNKLFRNFPVNKGFFSEAMQEANEDLVRAYEGPSEQEKSLETLIDNLGLERKVTFPTYKEAFGEDFQEDGEYFKPKLGKKSKKLRIIEKAENSNKEKGNFKFGANYESLEDKSLVPTDKALVLYREEKSINNFEEQIQPTQNYFSRIFSGIKNIFGLKQKSPKGITKHEFIGSFGITEREENYFPSRKLNKYFQNNLNDKAEDLSEKFIQAIFGPEKKQKKKKVPFIQRMRSIYGIPINVEPPSVEINKPIFKSKYNKRR